MFQAVRCSESGVVLYVFEHMVLRVQSQRTYRKDTAVHKGGTGKDEDLENEAGPNRPVHSPTEGDDSASTKATRITRRKSSVAKVVGRIIFNPNRKDVPSVEGGATNVVKEAEPSAPATKAASSNQFRFYRGYGLDQRVLQLSADSLLSITAQVCLYYSRNGMVRPLAAARKISGQHSRKISSVSPPTSPSGSFTKISLDPPSVTVSWREGGREGGRERGREGARE